MQRARWSSKGDTAGFAGSIANYRMMSNARLLMACLAAAAAACLVRIAASDAASGDGQEGVVETVSERLARLRHASEAAGSHADPVPSPRLGGLRGGGAHFRREYEEFDAEEKRGHLFNDTLERHEAHLETVCPAQPSLSPRPFTCALRRGDTMHNNEPFSDKPLDPPAAVR